MPTAPVGIAGFTADFFSECHLISGPDGNFCPRNVAAGRAVDQVNAERLKRFGQFD